MAAQLDAGASRRLHRAADLTERLLIADSARVWPGVRRAALPRQSPALTPGQRRRSRRRLDLRTAQLGNEALYTLRYTAFLCCDLAALSPAAAARLYISSVLPLKNQ